MKRCWMVEMPDYGNLNQYIVSLRNRCIPTMLRETICADTKTQISIEQLVNSRWNVFFREGDVRQIVSFFCESCIHAPVQLSFPIALRERAYMTDQGEMAISRCFLYGAGGARALKVVIHEIAHWWMAVQKSYGQLLRLDRDFNKNAQTAKWPMLLSPVEMLATQLECEILLSLSKEFGTRTRCILQTLGSQEQIRISTAISSLCL